MKYLGMPAGMWALFRRSFREALTDVLHYDHSAAKECERAAHARYHQIIARLPEFERTDQFKMNIVSCAMLAAFYLSMDPRPGVETTGTYYERAMMCVPMRLFCRISGKRKFSKGDIAQMRSTAALRAGDRNPYSWNMDYLPYPDGSGYEARFTKCGICTLMAELGIPAIVPAMCALDYAMSEAGGTTRFVREHTLASGGPYCDCGYKRKG